MTSATFPPQNASFASPVAKVGLVVAGVILFFSRQIYRESEIEQHLFCSSCNAVDAHDEGRCPLCGCKLSISAGFFYTSYSHEKKLLASHGLMPCHEGQLLKES